ncbi:M81 family metallopeptidase [Herbaspirillum sp. alder98]|uniref:M81 family metallopeptidase n=1 Tax=Herbaspirillum sp. alder98 TaxID=2913096 RepID=UPI001CD885E9|nr:M81 family metallopeptidase [Herbaspirillum sp. alder98]MCA1323835.1 M81 family metallopeptidase [Herbaspirillum sp. alder98]
MHIAVGGFQHETNTFSQVAAGWADFLAADTWPGLLQGDALISQMMPTAGTAPRNIPIAGFIDAARNAGAQGRLLPLAWSAAGPAGRVTREAFENMAALLLEGLRRQPVDAVYLDLHGAMAAEHADDADGELLRRVRAVIGPHVPLVASLDLHANVSAQMLESADLLLAYRTYPHTDMAATGAAVWHWLARHLSGAPRAHMAWQRVPFLIPMCWQSTGAAPADTLYRTLQQIETRHAAQLSFAMGFPAADVAKCGPTLWAYAHDDETAQRAARDMLDAVLAAEAQFDGEILDPDQAVTRALQLLCDEGTGPVLIADAQDNPGAGGSADTTGLLKALLAADVPQAVLGLLVDPQAAQLAHAAGVGASVSLALGGRSGAPGDTPLHGHFIVEKLHPGEVEASGSVFRGYRLTLGPSACLRIAGVRVVVVSKPVQLLDLALLRFIGIEPAQQQIIVLKSMVHFRADFAPLARAILVCAAPGLLALDPALMPWTRLPDGVRRSPRKSVPHP